MRADLLTALMVDIVGAAASGRKVKIPEAGRLVFDWFVELSNTRQVTPAGPAAITYAEIDAWSRLKRWPIEPRHVDLILAMDRAWLEAAAAAAQRTNRQDGPPLPTGLEPNMSTALFDAVFG